MKRKLIVSGLLIVGLFSSIPASPMFAAAEKDQAADLQARAKITEAKAREIARTKVPKGKIKEGELEEENGRLVWSFDIALKGKKDITEVQVDAITGEIVSVTKESAKDEADEAKTEESHGEKKNPETK